VQQVELTPLQELYVLLPLVVHLLVVELLLVVHLLIVELLLVVHLLLAELQLIRISPLRCLGRKLVPLRLLPTPFAAISTFLAA
jgi:hypothetical protein